MSSPSKTCRQDRPPPATGSPSASKSALPRPRPPRYTLPTSNQSRSPHTGRTPMNVLPCATPRHPVTTPGRPRLSVVVVNYLRWDDTARLVRQLRAAQAMLREEAEIVIVDNDSPPHPAVARLRRTE